MTIPKGEAGLNVKSNGILSWQ